VGTTVVKRGAVRGSELVMLNFFWQAFCVKVKLKAFSVSL